MRASVDIGNWILRPIRVHNRKISNLRPKPRGVTLRVLRDLPPVIFVGRGAQVECWYVFGRL